MTSNKKIMIVEDEKPLAHAMELKLKSAGFEVVVYNDGAQAINELEKNHFDLVMLDLIMPIADGFSVLKSMQARGDLTPVVVMSNLSQEEDKTKAISFGAKHFFVKSDTSLSDMVSQVESLVA